MTTSPQTFSASETCKIIAILHVIVFISTAILDLTRPSDPYSFKGFVTALAACFLSISWVLHSIICSFALSYVWNIILALLPLVGLLIFIMIKVVTPVAVHVPSEEQLAFRRAAEIYDRDRESQGNDQNENK